MRPISTVEKPAFIALVEGLSGHKPENRKTLKGNFKTKQMLIKEKLIRILKEKENVCTTADIWTVNQKSYLGSTIHYLDDDNFLRKTYLLGIRRLKFSHTFDEIGRALVKLNNDFELDVHKISGTVTDNAKNIEKCFREYSSIEHETDVTLSDSEDEDVGNELDVRVTSVDFEEIIDGNLGEVKKSCSILINII